MSVVDRRSLLRGLTAIPILAMAGGLGTAILSYLRPTLRPLEFPQAEKPINKPFEVASLTEFAKPYDFKEFVFRQETVEYTSRGKQATDIPGFVVRIPNGEIPASVGDAGRLRSGYAVAQFGGQTYSLVVVSRICPHLGCIFQYHEPATVCSDFNFCGGDNNLFACPCHLSVYDPTQTQDAGGTLLPGRVVSGPAPRPPFPFAFAIEGDKIVIQGYA